MNVNKIIKDLPAAKKAKVKKRASELIKEVNQNYLTITKITKNTECYNIIDKIDECYNASWIKGWLESGQFHLIQHAAIEPYIWVVNEDGQRVATLTKQGGDSSENIIIEVK